MVTRKNQLPLMLILVILITLVFFMLNMLWRLIDQTPAHWDMARHLATSFDYKELLVKGQLKDFLLRYAYYPPFYYYAAVPFFLVFGWSVPIAVASNIFFMLVLAVAVFLISSKIFSTRHGLLAAFLALTLPMLSSQFKEFQLDAPMAAMVLACLASLYYCENFSKPGESLLFGLIFGLGMLTKWTFFIFVMPPAFYLFIMGLVKRQRSQTALNVSLASLAVIMVCGPWYWKNHHQLRLDFTQGGITSAIIEGDPIGLTWPAFTYYFWTFLEHHLWLIGTILVTIAFILALLRTDLRRKLSLVLISVICGYLAFFKLDNKDARYIMPVVAQFPILIVALVAILPQKAQKMFIALLVALGLFTFLQTTFSWPFEKSFGFKINMHKINLYTAGSYTVHKAQPANWHLDDIFTKVKLDADDDKTIQFLGHDRMEFNRWDLAYYARVYDLVWVGENLSVVNYHYLIFRTVGADDLALEQQKLLQMGYNADSMDTWLLPDGSSAHLLKISRIEKR